ncbi:MAG: PHP domain-containing protein, partial [Kiloniellaceae bacterium]
MPHAGFVHLRVHSAYSLLEGALKIDTLIELCRSRAMPAVAVTDTGNLFGALEFALAACRAGVQPIVGCQLGIAPRGETRPGAPAPAPEPLVLLVQSEAGYRNLMRLVSMSYLETASEVAPQVTMADLAARGEGLIALTGGPAGPVGQRLLEGRDGLADEALRALAEIFPGRLYVEIMRHGLPAEIDTEDRLIELAYAHDLPLVATNEALFADEGMYEAHDALLC